MTARPPETETGGAAVGVVEPVAPVDGEPVARRQRGDRGVRRAAIVGALLAGVVFLLVLLDQKLTLLRSDPESDFFDLQAHSLLQGRWDVSTRELGLEGFHIDGKNYMYFGPWPAFLRLPIAALTSRFDGKLSQLSMLVAFAFAMFFVVRLVSVTRGLVRGDEPVTTFERIAVGAFVGLSGLGVMVFLATRLIVFHEAEIWGIALALGAFDLMLRYVLRPRGWMLVGATALTAAACLSRVAVGVGPAVGLGLLAVASVAAPTRRFVGLPETARRLTIPLLVALAVPIALYVYVNMAKFDTPFGLPFERQFISLVSSEHRQVLRENGGSLFGIQFVPTNLLQYLRPDGVRFSELWPWVRFPGLPTLVGDVRFDRLTPTTSVVAIMPLHAVLGVVGLVAMLTPSRARTSRIAALRVPVVGAVAGTGAVLAFGFMAQRYLGDFVPFLVLLGAIGLHVVVSWCARQAGRWTRTAVVAALGVVGVLAIWFGIGLAVLYQEVYANDDDGVRRFVRDQFALQRRFPGGAPDLIEVPKLPERAPLGTVAVVGDCRGVYLSSGDAWRGLERRNPSTGGYHLELQFAAGLPDRNERFREPLLTAEGGGESQMFVVATKPNGRHRFGYAWPHGFITWSRLVDLDPDRPHRIDIVLDQVTAEVKLSVDGERVLYTTTLLAAPEAVAPVEQTFVGDGRGHDPAPGRFRGSIREVAGRRDLCDELTGRDR